MNFSSPGGGGDSASSSASASNTFGSSGFDPNLMGIIAAIAVVVFALVLVLKK